jgi:hypothetical protein
MTDKQLVEWFECLYQSKAIFLWGANCEIITKKLTDKLFSWLGSKSYPKEYYDGKLKEGEGKIGADCSGSFYHVSGFDTTASGYYNRCADKDLIVKIPRSKVCQVFKKSGGKITHIGLYCGNGYTIEMKSSKDNCVKQKFNPLRWTYYGIPDWITYAGYDKPTKTITPKSLENDIKWLQDKLKIEADGIYGEQTKDAVRAFYKVQGWKSDGEKVGIYGIGRLNRC